MARRKISNPLALAVLACLYERPMHPYEMATTMRTRNKDESVKLNYGSLYSVVDALQRAGSSRPTRRHERVGDPSEPSIVSPTTAFTSCWTGSESCSAHR